MSFATVEYQTFQASIVILLIPDKLYVILFKDSIFSDYF
jgi:hypothetical protein